MNPTRRTKAGLILALLLGLSDTAILAALTGGGDKPPIAVVIISVAIGVATLVLAARAWPKPTRPLITAIIALRLLSAIGDIAAFGQDATVIALSTAFLVLCLIDIYLLQGWIKKPAPAHASAR